MTDEFQNLFEDNFLEDIKATSTEKLKEGERRIVSILFADISGFTKLSEKMDHEEIRDIIDKLFKLFTSCVEKYGGYVDKYAGDEIMALFGAKVASEVDTHRSISCAMSMLNTLDKFNSYIIKDPKFNIDESNKLSMRIGINTGMVTTGSVGKERTGDFTAYGKVVNLASRMESNAPINRIMVPENVMKQAQRNFSFNNHGMIKVKGFEDEISVYLVESACEIDNVSDKTPYIGNQSNLDSLIKRYNSSSSSLEEFNRSDLCTIGIRGEAGIGKSRLVSEFIRQVNQGITTNNIIRVAADNISVSPYQIFISIIKKSLLIERSDSQDVVLEKFNQGFKDISSILDGPLYDQFTKFKARIAYLLRLRITEETSSVSGQDLKDEIQLSMRIFIQAICARSNLSNVPFIVIIEDLQWIDIASLDVLNKIIDMESIGLSSSVQRNQALCFIFDYRDGYNIPDFIQKIDSFRELEINPLNRDECYDMIRCTMSEDIIPDEVVSVLMEHSNGNPFFIEEWLKSLGKELKWSINDINSWISSIPESMHSLILSGVDTLDEDSKQVLRCASVIGKRFYLDMIKQLEGKVENLSNVSKALEVLMKENFIAQDIRNKDSYIFRHTLTQEVTYESILKSNKKILHGLLADIIESNYQDKKEELVEQLANHYEKSENISKAKLYLIKAAKNSQLLYNLWQANDLYKRAIGVYILSNENLRGIVDGDIKNINQNEAVDFIDILHNHANTLMLLGEMKECSKILFSIKSILDKNLKDKKLYSGILGTIGKMYWLMGNYDESERIFREQLSLSQDLDQSDEKFDILLYIAKIQRARGNNKEALKQLNKLKDKFQDNNDLLSQVFGELGVAYKNEGDFDTALDYYQRQEEICIQNNKKNLLLAALGNIAVLHLLKKENQRALEIFDRMLMLNQEMGDKAVMSRTHGNKGIIFIDLKRYEDALRELDLQLKVCEYSRDSQGIGKAYSNKGNVYMEMSEHDKAISCFNEALNISLEIGNKREEGISLANLGEIFMKTGDTVKSREYLEKSLIMFRENGDINHEKMVINDIKKLNSKQ